MNNNSEKVSSASPSSSIGRPSSFNTSNNQNSRKKPRQPSSSNQKPNHTRSNSWSSSSRSSSISRSQSPVSPSSQHQQRPPKPHHHSTTRQVAQTNNHRDHQKPKRARTRSRSRNRSRDDKKPDTYDQSETEKERAEQYTSICIKNLNEKVDLDHLYDNIYSEFKRYGQFTIKIVNNKKSSSASQSYTERIAFVNFYNHETARAAKRDKMNKHLCGLPMYIEPVYKNYKPGTIPPPPPSSTSNPPQRQSSPPYYAQFSQSRSPRHNYRPPPPLHNQRRSRSRNRRSRSRSVNHSYPNHDQHSSRYRSRDPYEPYRKPHSPPPLPQQQPARGFSNRHDSSRPGDRHTYYPSTRRRSVSPQRGSVQPQSRVRTPPPKHAIKRDDLAYRLSRSRSRSRSRSPVRRAAPVLSASIGILTSIQGGVSHYFDNDDKDATRTLFIGNLGQEVEKEYLKRQFERYGRVEDIDIKKNQPAQPPYMQNGNSDLGSLKKTYAFVRYENMDMAKQAKLNMNGKKIGSNEIKIGYGKVQSTNCLWIGGLTEKSRIRDLEREIKHILNTNDSSKFDILHQPADIFAYVLFYNVKHAEMCRYDLRGKILPNSTSDKLRIDFHDPKQFNLLKSSSSSSSSSKQTTTSSSKRSKSKSKSKSPSPISTRRVVQAESPPPPPVPQEPTLTHESTSEEPPKPKKLKTSSVLPILPATDTPTLPIKFENIIITKIDNVRRVESVSINKSTPERKSRSRSASPPQKLIKLKSKSPTLVIPVKEPEAILLAPEKLEETIKEIEKDKTEGSNQSDPKLSRRHHHKHHKHHNLGGKPNEDRDEGEILDDEQLNADKVEKVEKPRLVVEKEGFLDEKLVNKAILSKRFKNMFELGAAQDAMWSGLFTLKRNSFPTKFYLLAGSRKLSEQLLPNKTDSFMNLQINQRIRLDSSKLDDIEKRLVESGDSEPNFSIFVSLPADLTKGVSSKENKIVHQQRSLHNLITYLNQKCAAGVVSLPDDNRPLANLNIFTPNSQLSSKLLKQMVPGLKIENLETNESFEENNYLIIVLLKNANASLNAN